MDRNPVCEDCEASNARYYSAFELESWGISQIGGKKKSHYYLCFDCFNKLIDDPMKSEKVLERLKDNRKHFNKLVEEGLVCPDCKSVIVDKDHQCEQ